MRDNFLPLRKEMVTTQIIARGIREPKVIHALLKTPREEFVPENLRSDAYQDRPLMIGCGQTISQPYMVAYMISLLELRGSENVLEIGTGSGYQAAILSHLCQRVTTIERIPELAEISRARLEKLGYSNVHVLTADGNFGYPEVAPYDGIIVSAAAEKVPEALLSQLEIDGILVVPIGPSHLQRIHIIRKTEGGFETRQTIQCIFVPLIGKITH